MNRQFCNLHHSQLKNRLELIFDVSEKAIGRPILIKRPECMMVYYSFL